mgnify:CR=1 FL=1
MLFRSPAPMVGPAQGQAHPAGRSRGSTRVCGSWQLHFGCLCPHFSFVEVCGRPPLRPRDQTTLRCLWLPLKHFSPRSCESARKYCGGDVARFAKARDHTAHHDLQGEAGPSRKFLEKVYPVANLSIPIGFICLGSAASDTVVGIHNCYGCRSGGPMRDIPIMDCHRHARLCAGTCICLHHCRILHMKVVTLPPALGQSTHMHSGHTNASCRQLDFQSGSEVLGRPQHVSRG